MTKTSLFPVNLMMTENNEQFQYTHALSIIPVTLYTNILKIGSILAAQEKSSAFANTFQINESDRIKSLETVSVVY